MSPALRLFSQFLVLFGTLVSTSCASQVFYNRVDGNGVILGRPRIDWVQPDKFVYDRGRNDHFAFVRHNGEVIVPDTIETDGGSIPRALWNRQGFTPWTYAPAYLVHDWLYEAHRRGAPGGKAPDGTPLYYTKDQADWIMAEVIKCQMENPEHFNTEKSPGRLKGIYWAVSNFGKTAWEDKPRPVTAPFTDPLAEALDNLPLRPVIEAFGDEFVPVGSAPPMRGTPTRQP